MVCLRSLIKAQGPKGGRSLVETYAIGPSVGQAQASRHQPQWEPSELSQQYGRNFFRFLDPFLQELDVTVDQRPLRTLVQTVEAMVAVGDQTHG